MVTGASQRVQLLIPRAQGEEATARARLQAFFDDFGRYEIELERYFDHALACRTLEYMVVDPKEAALQIGN